MRIPTTAARSEIIRDRSFKQLVIEPELTLKRIIDEPSKLQSKVHQLAGEDSEQDHTFTWCDTERGIALIGITHIIIKIATLSAGACY